MEPNQKKEALEPIGSSGGEWCSSGAATTAAPPWPAVLASRCSSSSSIAEAALTWPSFNSELTLYCCCLQYHKRDCSHPYISLCANEYKAYLISSPDLSKLFLKMLKMYFCYFVISVDWR